MTNKELAAALRICSRQKHCEGCPYFDEKDPLSIDCIRDVMTDAANAMRNHESHVLALQKEIEKLRGQLEVERRPQWVSVEERLPERGVDVLALVTGTHGYITFEQTQMIGTRLGKEGWFVGEYPDWDTPGVTHWMPIPEPPKEAKDDG